MQAGTTRDSIVASKTLASVNSQGSSILAFAAAALFRSSSTQSRSSGRSCKLKNMEADFVRWCLTHPQISQMTIGMCLVDRESKFCKAETDNSKSREKYPARLQLNSAFLTSHFNTALLQCPGNCTLRWHNLLPNVLSSCEYLAGLPIMNWWYLARTFQDPVMHSPQNQNPGGPRYFLFVDQIKMELVSTKSISISSLRTLYRAGSLQVKNWKLSTSKTTDEDSRSVCLVLYTAAMR